jgi:transposase
MADRQRAESRDSRLLLRLAGQWRFLPALSTDGRPTLFLLPAYSPELNPDEWGWKNVKHDRAGKTTVASKDDLKATVISALRRLQKLPALAQGFFTDPCLRYVNV